MKSSTSYQLKLIESATKKDIAVSVTIRGVGSYTVKDVRNLKHTVILTLKNSGGFVIVDPDEIVSVWVIDLPPAFKESQPHA